MPAVNKLDNYFSTRVLKLLLMSFREHDAFKLKLIDKTGKILKDPITPAEKSALTPLHVVIFGIRRMIEALPNGSSRLKQLAVALRTIAKKPVPNMYLAGISEEYSLEFIKDLSFVIEHDLSLLEEELVVSKYVESIFEEGEAPAPANVVAGIEPQGAPVIKPTDIKPKVVKRKALEENTSDTLYVSRPVKNHEEIGTWAKSQGFNSSLSDDMHVTICYSRSPVNSVEPKTDNLTLDESTDSHRKVSPLGDGGAIVLHIESNELRTRWQEFRDAGASWDYDGYNPHITISYDGKDLDIKSINPYLGKIVLGPEKFESLDEDWADKVEEK